MANHYYDTTHYYDATGVLVLDRVTPVIWALFGAFNLDPTYPGNGKAHIAWDSESNDPTWNDVLDRLARLAAVLDLLTLDDDDDNGLSVQSLFKALSNHFDAEQSVQSFLEEMSPSFAPHFGAEQNAELPDIIEHHQFEEPARLQPLLRLAWSFNDGHNLVAIQLEACWHCRKPRLFAIGGHGYFLSRELCVYSDSRWALEIGPALRKAILADDLDDASAQIAGAIRNLLSGICDTSLRARLCKRAIEHLLTDGSAI